jgi:hypothetical protein
MIDIKNTGFILLAMSADMPYSAEAANGSQFVFASVLGVWR